MWKDILPIIVQIVLIPLLTALTGVAVKWINSKANEIKAKTDNVLIQRTIDLLNETIASAVISANQTYVNELKQEDAFSQDKQLKAFEHVYTTVMNSLTVEGKERLEAYIGDIKSYITNKIEEEVAKNKIAA
jgi:hypothetical protein